MITSPTNEKDRVSIIVSEKERHRLMCDRICASTGREIILISDRQQFTFENLCLLNPEYIFFPHWSHKIPAEIYETFECVMFHMTDLPFGRGGSPLQNLIRRKVQYTKLCAFRCIETVDAGPVYFRVDLDLSGSASEILDRVSNQVEEMIVTHLIEKPVPVEQAGMVVEFTRRDPSDSALILCERYSDLFDLIRMVDDDDYPRSFLETVCARFEFSDVKDMDGHLEARVTIFPKERTGTQQMESDS